MGEFDIIARHFAPLSTGEPGAFNLKDDAAVLDVAAGQQIVVTSDCLISDVHFLANDPADRIAHKALAVNLSDLAAMGAEPRAYTLACAWPKSINDTWLKTFSDGLCKAQNTWRVTLIGGDTVATDGPLTLTVTAFGMVGEGNALRRSGAGAGDDVYVTGTIGDAALGLLLRQGKLEDRLKTSISGPDQDHLTDRYLSPEPRIGVGEHLVGIASGTMDISDGLVADLTHICNASALSADIQADRIPISTAASHLLQSDPKLFEVLITGGDDYELLFTAPESRRGSIDALSDTHSTLITRIGSMGKKGDTPKVRVMGGNGDELEIINKSGYRHF